MSQHNRSYSGRRRPEYAAGAALRPARGRGVPDALDRGDRGAGREEETEIIFSSLEAERDAIEERFGATLRWDRSEGRRALWVATDSIEGGYQAPEESWPLIQDHLIDLMVRFEDAFSGPIQRLTLG